MRPIAVSISAFPTWRPRLEALRFWPLQTGASRDCENGQPDLSIHDRGAAAVKGQECGNGVVIDHGDGLSTQYCHLAKGSIGVVVGQKVAAGTPVGKVGLSGQTEYPHLHLTVRRGDQVIDPFAPEPGQAGACGAGADLWTPEARRQLTYKSRAVLNAGFANGPVDMARIEAGSVTPFSGGDTLVAYVRAIGLKAGDRQQMTLKDPSGRVLASTLSDPLPPDQAQRMLYIGARVPPGGWRSGRYESAYSVLRDGEIVLSRTETISR